MEMLGCILILQEFVEITLTFFDSRKSGMYGPWISLDLGIIQIFLLDRMSGLIGREIVCSEIVKIQYFHLLWFSSKS